MWNGVTRADCGPCGPDKDVGAVRRITTYGCGYFPMWPSICQPACFDANRAGASPPPCTVQGLPPESCVTRIHWRGSETEVPPRGARRSGQP